MRTWTRASTLSSMSTLRSAKETSCLILGAVRDGRSRRECLYRLVSRMSSGVVIDRGFGTFLVPPRDYLGCQVFIDGHYEMDIMLHAMGLLEAHSPLNGRVFVDVGANIGTTTVSAIMAFGASRVVAIEPNRRNHTFLCANVALNRIADRTLVVRAAVSSSTETTPIPMAISTTNSGDHRLLGDASAHDPTLANRQLEAVRVVSLDDLLEIHQIPMSDVGLVWMDVQGSEGAVLLGAGSVTAAATPLVFEYWPAVLQQQGTLTALQDIIATNYTYLYDLRDPAAGRMSAAQLSKLEIGQGAGIAYTDVLAI